MAPRPNKSAPRPRRTFKPPTRLQSFKNNMSALRDLGLAVRYAASRLVRKSVTSVCDGVSNVVNPKPPALPKRWLGMDVSGLPEWQIRGLMSSYPEGTDKDDNARELEEVRTSRESTPVDMPGAYHRIDNSARILPSSSAATSCSPEPNAIAAFSVPSSATAPSTPPATFPVLAQISIPTTTPETTTIATEPAPAPAPRRISHVSRPPLVRSKGIRPDSTKPKSRKTMPVVTVAQALDEETGEPRPGVRFPLEMFQPTSPRAPTHRPAPIKGLKSALMNDDRKIITRFGPARKRRLTFVLEGGEVVAPERPAKRARTEKAASAPPRTEAEENIYQWILRQEKMAYLYEVGKNSRALQDALAAEAKAAELARAAAPLPKAQVKIATAPQPAPEPLDPFAVTHGWVSAKNYIRSPRRGQGFSAAKPGFVRSYYTTQPRPKPEVIPAAKARKTITPSYASRRAPVIAAPAPAPLLLQVTQAEYEDPASDSSLDPPSTETNPDEVQAASSSSSASSSSTSRSPSPLADLSTLVPRQLTPEEPKPDNEPRFTMWPPVSKPRPVDPVDIVIHAKGRPKQQPMNMEQYYPSRERLTAFLLRPRDTPSGSSQTSQASTSASTSASSVPPSPAVLPQPPKSYYQPPVDPKPAYHSAAEAIMSASSRPRQRTPLRRVPAPLFERSAAPSPTTPGFISPTTHSFTSEVDSLKDESFPRSGAPSPASDVHAGPSVGGRWPYWAGAAAPSPLAQMLARMKSTGSITSSPPTEPAPLLPPSPVHLIRSEGAGMTSPADASRPLRSPVAEAEPQEDPTPSTQWILPPSSPPTPLSSSPKSLAVPIASSDPHTEQDIFDIPPVKSDSVFSSPTHPALDRVNQFFIDSDDIANTSNDLADNWEGFAPSAPQPATPTRSFAVFVDNHEDQACMDEEDDGLEPYSPEWPPRRPLAVTPQSSLIRTPLPESPDSDGRQALSTIYEVDTPSVGWSQAADSSRRFALSSSPIISRSATTGLPQSALDALTPSALLPAFDPEQASFSRKVQSSSSSEGLAYADALLASLDSDDVPQDRSKVASSSKRLITSPGRIVPIPAFFLAATTRSSHQTPSPGVAARAYEAAATSPPPAQEEEDMYFSPPQYVSPTPQERPFRRTRSGASYGVGGRPERRESTR